MTTRVLPLLVLSGLVAGGAALSAAAPARQVTLTPLDDRVRVELGGQLFTEYIFKGAPRPYLYPVLAADGTKLVRDYPMVKEVPGEETDHVHHRSLWFTHGAVNGVDFWLEGATKGLIVSESVKSSAAGGVGTIQARNRWVGPDGKLVCTDDTTLRFQAVPDGRLLDYEVTIHALPGQPLVFGDTKEGSLGFRVAQWMTMTHNYQKKKVESAGHAVNDAGQRDAAAWGQRAKWVDYFAPKGGKVYGVAIFDHPQNPRHPTWWHVRDYGLFAANPFGQHDFEGTREKPLPANAGDLTVPAGGSVTFRYRIYLHLGDAQAAGVAQRYADYAAGK